MTSRTTEIVGEAKKQRLLEFRDDLIEINRQNRSSIERLKQSLLDRSYIDKSILNCTRYIENNNETIKSIEIQLKQEFDYNV